MARTRNDVQTAVRMPTDLYERLQEAAGDHPLGEEIRRRLEASFLSTSDDPKTGEFTYVLTKLADTIGQYFAPWHADPFSFAMFKFLANSAMRPYQTEGELVPKPKSGTWDVQDGTTPETVASELMMLALGSLYRSTGHPVMDPRVRPKGHKP